VAHIDNFISMMIQRRIDRAVLINDKPAHLYSGSQDLAGPIIPKTQLQLVVQEATPPQLRPQLAQEGTFHFPYESPHGTYDINVENNNGTLRVGIRPYLPGTDLSPEQSGDLLAHDPLGHTKETPYPAAAIQNTRAGASAEPAAMAARPAATARGTRQIEHIDELLHMMQRLDASDLHLSSGETPMMRVQGVMRKLEEYAVQENDSLKKVLFAIAPERNQNQWETERDTDFAYEVPGLARFRCNFFADRHGIGAVFRLIPSQVLTVEQLKLPKAMTDLCFLSKGLVVVTGPTGSGKSTTLAALIDHINKHREDHIITIEDPVEFVHNNIKCLINQREVHVHTSGFKRALRAALREDPDIVLVGEMRDLETIAIAIETAETGHLVFGTLHTTTAPSTVDRIIDQFPADQQAQIRVMLSESLKGVIAQTLLRTKDGKRVAAHEILLVPTAVANLIREGKTFQLPSQMQIGKSQGMVTMNDSIVKFVKEGRVDPMEGYIKAVDKIGVLQSYQSNGIESPIAESAG
jgi:twitching motility protein PilT